MTAKKETETSPNQNLSTDQCAITSNLVDRTNQLALSSPGHSETSSPSTDDFSKMTFSTLQIGDCLPSSTNNTTTDKNMEKSNPSSSYSKPSSSNIAVNPSQQIYHVKYISWNTGTIPIVMQSINGPCPLIAIVNVLSLREKLKLPASSAVHETISSCELLQLIAECLMNCVPDEVRENDRMMLDFEQNINDAIEILPKLATGLDVNVKFSGIFDFEYTSECIIFDLLRIPLFHGWLVEPESAELTKIIQNKSYNQLVDYIISCKNSTDINVMTEVCIVEIFLNNTASQLTEYGLMQLKHNISDNEIGILFRNNHFSTIFKHEGEIYQLVTDHGFSKEDITWETLDNIDGNSRFLTWDFRIPVKTGNVINQPADELKQTYIQDYDYKDSLRQQQMENDLLMALSLKQEEENQGTDNWNAP